MFIETFFYTNCENSLFDCAGAGVFKRKQEGGKEILISLPMDFERPSLSLVRTMERQGFYDE